MTDKRTVLVVDDDEMHREIFLKTVRALGHEATGASSAQNAKLALETRPFDLVLLDVNLSDVDGIKITREVRAAPIRQPVILGLLDDEDEDVFDECIEAGMDGVISKTGSMGLLRRYLPVAGPKPKIDLAPADARPLW